MLWIHARKWSVSRHAPTAAENVILYKTVNNSVTAIYLLTNDLEESNWKQDHLYGDYSFYEGRLMRPL